MDQSLISTIEFSMLALDQSVSDNFIFISENLEKTHLTYIYRFFAMILLLFFKRVLSLFPIYEFMNVAIIMLSLLFFIL